MSKSMMHLNGNLLCAVDVETTGLVVGYHDIWQVAILPLDSFIKPLRTILPFYMDMKIRYPEHMDTKAIKLPRQDFARRQQCAIELFSCADLLDEWFDRLKLPIYKRIIPLAQNWPFDRSFLIEWLGILSFERIFNPVFRDTMVAAAFDSDLADFKSEPILFTQHNLPFISTRLGVKNLKPHDALQDAITTAECYRRMLLRR